MAQVDDIHILLRIAPYGVRVVAGAQQGMAEGDETRVIISHPIHGARAQPPNQSYKAILRTDLWRPTEEIPAESDTCCVGHEEVVETVAFHELNEERHPFIIIKQTFGAPVE